MTASTAFNASNELKRLASFARGIIALEEDVARYGSLSQAIEEAGARCDKLNAAEAALRDQRAAAEREHADALEGHRKCAEEFVAAAKKEAGEIVARGQADADALITQAKQHAEAMLLGVAAQAHKHEEAAAQAGERAAGLGRNIAELEAEQTRLIAEVDELRERHDNLKGMHADFLASIGARRV